MAPATKTAGSLVREGWRMVPVLGSWEGGWSEWQEDEWRMRELASCLQTPVKSAVFGRDERERCSGWL